MDCREAQPLLDAYIDSELDVVTHLAVEQHVQDCADCGARRRARMKLQSAIRQADLYKRAPAAIGFPVPASPSRSVSIRPILLMAACLLLAIGIAGIVLVNASSQSRELALADQVVASHVRSLMVDHLADVVSTDQHTVKPWFTGKIDFAPEVKDFASDGFELTGGRLDYLDKRSVAALVYRRHKHTINVFIWPGVSGSATPTELHRDGFNVEHFVARGMNYWLVSDLNSAELSQLGQLIRQ